MKREDLRRIFSPEGVSHSEVLPEIDLPEPGSRIASGHCMDWIVPLRLSQGEKRGGAVYPAFHHTLAAILVCTAALSGSDLEESSIIRFTALASCTCSLSI